MEKGTQGLRKDEAVVGLSPARHAELRFIGRIRTPWTTQDAKGKTHARFTNLIAESDASEEAVTDAVNNTLKAIAASLLMEQVLAPRFNFKPKKADSGPTEGVHLEESACICVLICDSLLLQHYYHLEAAMKGQPGFFDFEERYAQLSKAGDPLEKLSSEVNFEAFRYRLHKGPVGKVAF